MNGEANIFAQPILLDFFFVFCFFTVVQLLSAFIFVHFLPRPLE